MRIRSILRTFNPRFLISLSQVAADRMIFNEQRCRGDETDEMKEEGWKGPKKGRKKKREGEERYVNGTRNAQLRRWRLVQYTLPKPSRETRALTNCHVIPCKCSDFPADSRKMKLFNIYIYIYFIRKNE